MRHGQHASSNEEREIADDIRLEEIQVTESSGNVSNDLGLPDAEEALAKADLAIALNRIMEERGLTERKTAAILGTSQACVHNVRRGRFAGVSIDWLFQALNRLGHDVGNTVRPNPVDRPHAYTRSQPTRDN
jgi:predicted XRE-type DNA-binding protein